MSMSHGFAMNGNEPVFSDQERVPVDHDTVAILRSFYPLANNQELVRQFHEAFDAPAADNPQEMGWLRGDLRIKMIQEELDEFSAAIHDKSIVEQYDALLDILVLAYGGLVEMGIDAGPGFREVMRANMSKLGEDGKPVVSRGMEQDGFPEGKILKGPNYVKPDLFNELVKQNWTPTYEEYLAFYGLQDPRTVIEYKQEPVDIEKEFKLTPRFEVEAHAFDRDPKHRSFCKCGLNMHHELHFETLNESDVTADSDYK